MVSVCFYFQVHQPVRMRRYPVFDIGRDSDYFDHKKNEQVVKKVAKKCYLPTNRLINELIRKTRGKFRVSYSITGTALEQFQEFAPEVIESFKELADTGHVEFLSETYYHTLAYLYSKQEFREQVSLHKKMVRKHFKQTPRIFRNTELVYNNELARTVEDMGYKGILAEGADHILGWRSPNYIYQPQTSKKIRLLLKNYKLSDDIAFRFSNRGWSEHPLTARKFADWVAAAEGQTVNLFMDYETFGEHQWEDTGIFSFLEHLPSELMRHSHIDFRNPSEMARLEPVGKLDVHHPVSWADVERDLSAWLGNRMQQSAIQRLYELESYIRRSGDKGLLEDWRKLQTSDHFYYMCTKWFSDGDVHKYFNPYDSPYDGFIAFMNAVNDIVIRLKTIGMKSKALNSCYVLPPSIVGEI
ncbi:polysaccharide deacetylase family protein [Candidatus Woesearchaeota archaeon]|nr:polysaccharide deacetylase family protein [Candidatus Woesearchaeota archaeon]